MSKPPMSPILLRLWVGAMASGYLHSWAGAVLDHVRLERFALVCEIVAVFSTCAAMAFGIAYFSYRSDGE